MPVFFLPPECIVPPTISITGDLLLHLRDSLRITLGEIVLFADDSRRYQTEIAAMTQQSMTGRIIEVIARPPAHSPSLLLGQALLKGEKMDWAIQKATELGVSEILPIQSRHSVVRIRAERVDAQVARWRRIAVEAAQQSEQWRVPAITLPQSLAALLTTSAAGGVTLMLAERREGMSLQTAALPHDVTGSVLVLIGPEGGWSKEEVEMAERAGVEPITLGRHILRAETAALAAISILQSRLGHLG
jgi:16S rRNA (uracil1498-N3)-methyltransferase